MPSLLADLVATSAAVAATRSRRAKVAALAERLAALEPGEVPLGAVYLAGRPRQERLDVGWAAVREADIAPAPAPSLTLADVDAAFDSLAGAAGTGSRGARRAVLASLLGRATAAEQEFLRKLLLGDLRQGALEGVVVQAVADAARVPVEAVRRALLLTGDLGSVAATALREGEEALAAVRLELFRPLQPMLASTAHSVEGAVAEIGGAAVEWKLDGARVQVHRDGDTVRVYTRNLRDATARSGDVVAAVLPLPARRLVLDGEVLALASDGRPVAFQDTMSSFGRGSSGAALTPFFFDLLHVDGADLLDEPLRVRRDALDAVVPASARVPSRVVHDGDDGRAVLDEALAAGHEGVMVKALDAPYEAGRRGAAWRKVKPVRTVDLVVLAVEWGSGRRRGWLSNLHLGARDPDGGFVMVGKTFKGMTDEMLRWQTQRFLELETHRDGHIVHVRPEQVVEVAFDGIQTSRRYPGGLTLRFARVRGYRDDKHPADADTLDAIRAIAGAATEDGDGA